MSENNIIETVSENLPIKEAYDDLLHPSLSTVGQALQGVTRVALAPISAMVWGYDKIAAYLDVAIPQYFEKRKIKQESVVTPDPSIAVPTVEAMRYTSHVPELREMFTNLLGAAMNAENRDEHPAFVEIIKQLSSDECKMLKYLSRDPKMAMLKYRMKVDSGGEVDILPYYSNICEITSCQYPQKFPEYLDNLHRLGLVDVFYDRYLVDDKYYDVLRTEIKKVNNVSILTEKKSMYALSEMGKKFCAVCIS